MNHKKVSYFLIAILTVAHQIIAALWYSPYLFMGAWLSAQNKTLEGLDRASSTPFLFSIVSAIAVNWALNWFFIKVNVHRALQGALVAFMIWFAFLFLPVATHSVTSGGSANLLFIDMGKEFVGFMLSGLVLGALI